MEGFNFNGESSAVDTHVEQEQRDYDPHSFESKYIPKEEIDNLTEYCLSQPEEHDKNKNERLREYFSKIHFFEQIIDNGLKEENLKLLEKSVLLLGPMATGKSTISSLLLDKFNNNDEKKMSCVSLDNRRQLRDMYKQQQEFDKYGFEGFKDFEFLLTTRVLSQLKEESIVNFGGGHGVQEDPAKFLLLKELIKHSNAVVLMPHPDREESIRILNERLEKRRKENMNTLLKEGKLKEFAKALKNEKKHKERQEADNRFFVNFYFDNYPNNLFVYTEGKSPQQTAEKIFKLVEEKRNKQNN